MFILRAGKNVSNKTDRLRALIGVYMHRAWDLLQ